MNFLKVILIIALVYYLIRLLLRFLFPFVFQQYVSHKIHGYSGNSNKHQKQRKSKEGEITIEQITEVKSRSRRYKGEYIDYEEIKDQQSGRG